MPIFVVNIGYGEGQKSKGKTSEGIHLSKTGSFIFFYDAAPLWNGMCVNATGWILMKFGVDVELHSTIMFSN